LSELLRTGYRELEQLLEQQEETELRIGKLSQKIIQLAIASDDPMLVDAVKETGLTDAVRTVLRASEVPLTATDIRKRLLQIGFDYSNYQNFLATLYLTLKRMEKQNEVTETPLDGKKAYKWRSVRPLSIALFDRLNKTMDDSVKVKSTTTKRRGLRHVKLGGK